jgi:hypothetical protein
MHEKFNNAVSFGCHELDNNDIVFWKGNYLKWERIKTELLSKYKWNL